MTKQVKTLWNSQVAVAEKFVLYCLENKEPLVIEHAGKVMAMNPDYLETQIESISKPFQDRRGGEDYRLVYYLWKPTQPTLL